LKNVPEKFILVRYIQFQGTEYLVDAVNTSPICYFISVYNDFIFLVKKI